MELRHLRYFVAVAEELNFHRAAERLAMAQPPLSQQIHDLEAELGVTLFDRTNRAIRLTEAGRVFLEDVYEVLAQTEQAVHRVQRASKGELGRLTIGYTSLIYNPLFPAILRLHRKRYPNVELILHDLVTFEQMQQLRTNILDVSFATHATQAIKTMQQEILNQEPVWHEALGALLPAEHELAKQAQLTLAALANEPWIWFARQYDPTTYDYMMHLFEQVGFLPNIIQEINQQQVILSLIAAGFGVSLAPKSTPGIAGNKDIAFRDLIDPTPVVEFNVIWRRGDNSPVLLAFLDIVREVAQDAVKPA